MQLRREISGLLAKGQGLQAQPPAPHLLAQARVAQHQAGESTSRPGRENAERVLRGQGGAQPGIRVAIAAPLHVGLADRS